MAPGKLDKLNKIHDKIWEYYPQGLKDNLIRFFRHYNKPVYIIENGCCTDSDNMKTRYNDKMRVKSIQGHLKAAHEAIEEGVDLKDAMSRFQIIAKIPFPSLADPVVKKRMTIRSGWYDWVTLLSLIQSHGRSIRSSEDFARTYMLDSNFRRLYGKNKHYLPKYFRESVVW